MPISEDLQNVNYIAKGDGPPVVLVHGVAVSIAHWRYLIPVLIQAQFRVYALDLLGHGESAKPENGYNIEAMYDHFAGWLASLALDQPPALVGHSMGGYLSLCHALRSPGLLRRLVLIDPFYKPDQLSTLIQWTLKQPELSASVLQAAPKWTITTALKLGGANGDALPKPVRERLAEDYKRTHPEVLKTANTTEDLSPRLSQVRAPVLLLWGDNDPTLDPNSFPKLAERLPNATTHHLPHTGHLPHLAQAEEVNQVIVEFLKKAQN